MCGRYTAAKDFSEQIKLVGILMARVPVFAPRYNIAPTQLTQNGSRLTPACGMWLKKKVKGLA